MSVSVIFMLFYVSIFKNFKDFDVLFFDPCPVIYFGCPDC